MQQEKISDIERLTFFVRKGLQNGTLEAKSINMTLAIVLKEPGKQLQIKVQISFLVWIINNTEQLLESGEGHNYSVTKSRRYRCVEMVDLTVRLYRKIK